MGKQRVSVRKLVKDADEYIREAMPPIVAEYANQHGISRQYIYQLGKKYPEVNDTIKKIIDAKEICLERNGLNGNFNPAMAIFSLKQLGWRDLPKEEAVESGSGGGKVELVVRDPGKLRELEKKAIQEAMEKDKENARAGN